MHPLKVWHAEIERTDTWPLKVNLNSAITPAKSQIPPHQKDRRVVCPGMSR